MPGAAEGPEADISFLDGIVNSYEEGVSIYYPSAPSGPSGVSGPNT